MQGVYSEPITEEEPWCTVWLFDHRPSPLCCHTFKSFHHILEADPIIRVLVDHVHTGEASFLYQVFSSAFFYGAVDLDFPCEVEGYFFAYFSNLNVECILK